MFDEEFEQLRGVNAPLTDEDYAAFGLGPYDQDQLNQGNFASGDFNLSEFFGEPDA